MKASSPTKILSFALTLALFLASSAPAAPAQSPPKPKPAQLKVTGFGFLGDRELRRMLITLEFTSKKAPEFFAPSFVEDAALLLTSRVKRDGFLEPSITVQMRLASGGKLEVEADSLTENPLPRPLRIKSVRFKIHKGLLFYYQQIQFEGLQSLKDKEARAYFVETGNLLPLKKSRAYTPEKLRRSVANLEDILDRQGYPEAKVEAGDTHQDDKTGAVTVRIKVTQGRRFVAHSVREQFNYEGTNRPDLERIIFLRKPYSKIWLQDFVLGLKTNEYRLGYPDVSVQVETIQQKPQGQNLEVDLLAKIQTGPKVRIGAVNFEGDKRTRPALMSRRVRVKRGELLDPVRIEEGRYRLAQLGVFDTVSLDYHPVDEHTRDVLYRVKEGKALTVSLLFGYGSYELLRGGVEVEENDIWGRAHHARIKAVQSFKATSGEFDYTIPDFTPEDLDLFLNASGLRREEVSFTREEYGGGVGVHKYLKAQTTDLSIRYNYQVLSALDTHIQAIASEGVTNPAVGAILINLKYDRRDNPLYPHKGYKVFANLETASEYFGGDVNYQRLEMFASWHHPLGNGHWLSLGFSHGVDMSFGSPANNLPFNRRFFPGGENSIRGYSEDEASPRNDLRQIVGAETYMLGTVEFEQALTRKWSVVLFSDSLGFAHHIAQYPFDTTLYSVGGGLRWKTIIGPIRLEYGYNLNPRLGDPSGALLFSVGYPF